MKRKVDYILTTVSQLTKQGKLQDVLNQIKEKNHYHYVATPNGDLIKLKDPELNNRADAETYKVECIHLLILMPHPNLFNIIFYLIFRAYPLSRKMEALSKNFPNARVLDENEFYDDCLRKLERENIELDRNLLELEKQIARQSYTIHELNSLGLNDHHQN